MSEKRAKGEGKQGERSTEMSRNKNQRTSDSTAISEFGSGDKVLSATTNPVRKGTAPECANPKMAIFL